MYKRYAGNSGAMRRVEDAPPPPPPPPGPPPPPPPAKPGLPGLPEGLFSHLLSGLREGLETEDLLLLLILYLLYRESGEHELLVVMGAMLLLE